MNKEKSIDAAKLIISDNFGISNRTRISNSSGYMYEAKPPKNVAKHIVEIEGEYIGSGMEKETIILKELSSEITLMMAKETTYSNSILEGKKIVPGESLYVIAIKVEDYPIYIPVTVIRKSEKEIFGMVRSLYGRANAIKDFYKLEKSKQEYILKQLNSERYKRFVSDSDVCFDTKQEQMLKYAITKETYTTDTQRVMESMFKDTNTSKHKVDQRQAYLSRIATTCSSRVPIKLEEFGQILDERFYKMNRPKQLIKDIFAATERAEKKGCKVLFVGAPGVGKTSLMMAIADAMQLPYECIPLNGLSCPFELEGLDPGYDSADAGAIVKAMAAHGTSQMVIALDEFDKMNRNSKEGDPMNVFLRLFLGNHYDKFLGCTIKTDNTVFIATANSVEDIPEAILNRFNAIIYLDDYSNEEKMVIAKQYIIPDIFKNYNVSLSNITFEDDAIECIISNYCEDYGARDLKNNIERVVSRIIGSERADTKMKVTTGYVETILSELVEETPGLYFVRNEEAYTEPVAKEIRRCLEAAKKTLSFDADRFSTEKMRHKLEYLLACRKEEQTFMYDFNPNKLSDYLHSNLFGMDKVIREITNFYYTEYLQGTPLNSNLALCGGFGIGKTTIVKSIAECMGYKYVKISLNGIEDVKELRGFSSTYVGSEPGRIIKGIKEAGTTRVVLQLDEIDKLKSEFSTTILDLVDREFTDNFLDVPIDLSQAIFIATANEWNNVTAVLRDRFIVIDVDGYTRDEKSQIVTDYIIPKIERSYMSNAISISIDAEAEEFLLRTYANSFGVRDVEKAIQRICSSKLVDQASEDNSMTVFISKDDISKYLGPEPVPRGNFPNNGSVPGVSKALAVSNGNLGSTFAIETVLIDGEESLEMTGLPKETAIDSVKIAVTCIKKMYPSLLQGKQIHVHFGEGSVSKDGPSAGVALFMSILSAALNKPLMFNNPYDVAYTGEISLTGGVYAIGGTFEKIQAACDSGCCKVFIPLQNYERLEKNKLAQFNCEVIPVSHISQVIEALYPKIVNYEEVNKAS